MRALLMTSPVAGLRATFFSISENLVKLYVGAPAEGLAPLLWKSWIRPWLPPTPSGNDPYKRYHYRSGTVNSKLFIGEDFLRNKWKYGLTVHFKHEHFTETLNKVELWINRVRINRARPVSIYGNRLSSKCQFLSESLLDARNMSLCNKTN